MPSASAAWEMPSIARASSYAISGFSGLPKLRQSVRPIGSPPAHATLRAAPSTACTPAANGSDSPGRGPCSATASPRSDGRSRSTAASNPGRRTVREPTSWSYRSKIHVLSRRFSGDSRGGAAGHASRSRCSTSYRGHSSVSSRAGIEPTTSPPCSARSSPSSGDLADRRAVQLPARAHGAHRVEHLRADDGDHPLLRLGDHDLPRLHPLLAQRHAVEMDVEAGAVGRHLGERGREPGGAAVLERLDEPRLDELDGDLDQLLARERIADLHGRPLVRVVLAELLAREHGRAADPVAAGGRAVEHDEVARAGRLRRLQPRRVEDADAHRVDEAVAAIGLVEDGRAADGGDADAVPVVADPADRAGEVEVRRAEPEPVQQRDRPRAHGDDVPQDPADAGRGPLERLDRGRMVVRLDLEGDGDALPEVEHAGVLARAPAAPALRRTAAASAASPSACTRSAPTRGARRPPARNGSGRGREALGFGSPPSR